MKTFLLLFFTLYSLHASSTLSFHKGWKLMGIATELHDTTLFDNENIEIVWAYDAPTQKWMGYSPNPETMRKIEDANISMLSSLKPYQAFWILSKESWSAEIDNEANIQNSNNEIVLSKGWNLVTLPNKAMVYRDFFGDEIVWKYNQEWSTNDKSLSFPTLSAIKESDGFWVYSKVEKTIDMGEELSKLSTFESEEQMREYLSDMLQNNYRYRYYDYYTLEDDISMDTVMEVATTDDGSSNDAVTNATTTNLQESDVDEADILKHNDTYIFSITNKKDSISIHSFADIAKQNYESINTILIEEDYIIEMYLQDDTLIVLSHNYDSYSSVQVHFFDISDINNVKLLAKHSLNGHYINSRLVNKKLFLITNFTPYVSYEYEKIYASGVCAKLDYDKVYAPCVVTSSSVSSTDKQDDSYEEDCYQGEEYNLYNENECYYYNYDADGKIWKYDYDNPIVTIERLTPQRVSNDVNSSLLTPSKFYAPKKLDQSSTITSLSSFDVESTEFLDSMSVLGYMSTTYASNDTLYLSSDIYPYYFDFYNYKQREMIYKFSLGETLSYKGRGFVEGHTLNQFSMSEKDGYLRVATTLGNSWSGLGTDNIVYTLQENNDTLEISGMLTGLGKENETIKAVRFMGDRGFVVTFEQTDPLYTLDLSDPKKPKKVGELSIPGFSSYLHIVDENRVLSIGRDADENGVTQGLQIQLFDVSDFANPMLADKIQIGTSATESAAEYNHKAFTYRSSDMLFGIPYRDYSNYNYDTEYFGVYKVNGMSLEEKTMLEHTGNYWSYDIRGVIFDLNSTTYGTLIDGESVVCEEILQGE